MVDKLAAKRFLAVVGTSGSGKSSLVNCGLRPALRRGMMAQAGSAWRMAQFRPGGNPIKALARALARSGVLFTGLDFSGEALEDMIEGTLGISNLGVVDLFEQAKLPPQTNLLLIVDQFEELFRYRPQPASPSSAGPNRSDERAVAFVNLLLEAAKSEFPIYLVLTMRSDFFGDCARFPGLPEAVNEGQYLVPRLTRDERRAAITGPIKVGGGEISPVLLTRLINDVGDNPDQLPILQHALNRTWAEWHRERHGREPISLSHYEAIGTMAHALDRHAERAFAELTTERQKKICEVIFQALTDKGNEARGIRRPTDFATLCAIANASPAEVMVVLDVFRKPSRSFLMPPHPEPVEPETVIDISHESLMRVWNRLRDWVDREAESAGQYRRLVQSTLLYAKGAAGLMIDPELSLMLEWQKTCQQTAAWATRYDSCFTQAMEFLESSHKERDRLVAERKIARRRKFRQIQSVAGVLGLLAAIALFLAVEAGREKRRAEYNLQSAKEAVDASLSSAGSQQAREAADLPEMEKFREELLGKAETFYAKIAERNSNNEGLRTEVAWAHARLGDINRLLQKPEKAVQEYNQAISGFEDLVKDYPRKNEYRGALAYAHNWLGETLRAWLEDTPASVPYTLSDGEKQYAEALRLQQQMHDDEPTNSLYQQELARTYYNRGIIRYDSKNPTGAESDFRAAIALLEPLKEKPAPDAIQKTTPDPSQDLARAYNNLANMIGGTNPAAAEQLYEQARELVEALGKKQADNREYQLELAEYYNNEARLLVAEKKLDSAKEKNHRAVDIIEGLAAPSPFLSMELVKALQLRTEILVAQGSPEAQRSADRLLETLRMLTSGKGTRIHPVFHVLYMNLGINYIKLAQKNLDSGDVNGAKAALENLAQILPELSTADGVKLSKYYLELQKEMPKQNVLRKQHPTN